MCKKMIAMFMSLTLFFAVLGVNVPAATPESNLDLSNSKDLRLSGNAELFTEIIGSERIDTFNNADVGKYSDYEVILVDNNTLSAIEANKLVELIDNGTTLWVEDSNLSLKEVAKALNLDEPDDRFVKGAQVTGTFIFNQNNHYCFGVTGLIETIPEELYNQTPHEDNECYSYDPIPIYQSGDKFENTNITNSHDIKFDLENFINSVDKFRSDFNKQACKEIETDKVYMQLPEKSFDGAPFYNYFTMAVASMTITQYRYEICLYREGKIDKQITDVVSNITIAASPYNYVGNYKIRMHANISNMDVIGQSYLQSNSSFSYTLSGGFSTSGTILNGSLGASTTNTYSTNNQTIQNDFYYQKYKNWNSDPTKRWFGASWQIEPCIRVRNNNATTYNSQAYTSFQGGFVYGDYYDFTGYAIPTVEVGGMW